MNKIAKKAAAWLLAAMILLTAVLPSLGAVNVYAEGGAVVRVHYNRPDGKCDGWSVWMWPKDGDGAEGGRAAVAPISAMVLVKEDTLASAKTESAEFSAVSTVSTSADRTESTAAESKPEETKSTGLPVPVIAGMIAAVLLGVFVMVRAGRKNK